MCDRQSTKNSQPFLHLLKNAPFFTLYIVLVLLSSYMTDNHSPAKKKSPPSDEQFLLLLHDLSFHISLLCPLVAVLTLISFLAPCHTGTQSGGTIFSFKNQGLHLAEFTGHTSLWMKSYCKVLSSRLRGHPLTSARFTVGHEYFQEFKRQIKTVPEYY